MSNNLAWLCLLAATGVVSGRGVDPVLLNISPSRVCAGDTLNVSFTVRSPSSSLWAELWVDAKEGAAVPAYPVSRFRAHRGRFSVQTAEGRVATKPEGAGLHAVTIAHRQMQAEVKELGNKVVAVASQAQGVVSGRSDARRAEAVRPLETAPSLECAVAGAKRKKDPAIWTATVAQAFGQLLQDLKT